MSEMRSLFPFYLVIFLWGASAGLLTPVFPLYIRSLGFSIQDWGTLVMVYAVSTFLFEWAWGVLSDRFDRRLFVALGLLSGSILVPLYAVKALIPFFYVLQFLRGVFFIMVGPAVKALVSDMSESGRLGLSMGLYSATRMLGGVLGPFLGSYVAELWSYEYAFYFYSALSLIGAAITVKIKTGRRAQIPVEKGSLSSVQGWRSLFTQGQAVLLFVLPVIIFMGHTAINSYLPVYARERVGMSTLEVGTVFSIMNLLGFLTTPLFGWASDRLGRRPVVLLGFSSSAVMLFSLFFVRTPLHVTLASIGFAMCFSPITPLLLTMLAEFSPRRLLGTAMGIYSTFENLGTVIAPPIYSAAWSAYAPETLFLFGALVQAIGMLLLLSNRLRRR